MLLDSEIKDRNHPRYWRQKKKKANSSLAFVQSDRENLYLVIAAYPNPSERLCTVETTNKIVSYNKNLYVIWLTGIWRGICRYWTDPIFFSKKSLWGTPTTWLTDSALLIKGRMNAWKIILFNAKWLSRKVQCKLEGRVFAMGGGMFGKRANDSKDCRNLMEGQ